MQATPKGYTEGPACKMQSRCKCREVKRLFIVKIVPFLNELRKIPVLVDVLPEQNWRSRDEQSFGRILTDYA